MALRTDEEAGGNTGGGTAGGSFPNLKSNLPDDVAVRSVDVNFEDQMKNSEARVTFSPTARATNLPSL